MKSASKTTFSHCDIKILMLKVIKNLTNLLKKFCEFRPRKFLRIEFEKSRNAFTIRGHSNNT